MLEPLVCHLCGQRWDPKLHSVFTSKHDDLQLSRELSKNRVAVWRAWMRCSGDKVGTGASPVLAVQDLQRLYPRPKSRPTAKLRDLPIQRAPVSVRGSRRA